MIKSSRIVTGITIIFLVAMGLLVGTSQIPYEKILVKHIEPVHQNFIEDDEEYLLKYNRAVNCKDIIDALIEVRISKQALRISDEGVCLEPGNFSRDPECLGTHALWVTYMNTTYMLRQNLLDIKCQTI